MGRGCRLQPGGGDWAAKLNPSFMLQSQAEIFEEHLLHASYGPASSVTVCICLTFTELQQKLKCSETGQRSPI